MIDLANGFAERGYAVDLVVLKPVGQYAEQVDARVRVVSLDARRIILSLPKFVSYLRREPPEVLLALDEYTHLLALFARKISRAQTRIFLRVGNMFSELFTHYQGWKNKTLPFFVQKFYKYADGIIANSHGVADDIIKVTGIDKNKVSVIYNPKNLEFIRTRSQEEVGHIWLARKTVPVIIAVGRLRVQKNFPLLIRAFVRVVRNIPSRLIIIGGGREEERLRALLRELDCEDIVSLPGYQDNPYAYMSKADLFVSASLWEGMPNTILEALVCGLPVIASDCDSGPREILAPDTDYRFRLKSGIEYAKYGVLFAVNDENALVEAMTKLLRDTALRREYASRTSERIKEFDSQKILDDYARALGITSIS